MKTIEERITDSIFYAMGQVGVATGYEETLEVNRESQLSDGDAPADMQNVKVTLVSHDLNPAPTMPISKDDYLKTYFVQCRAFEPDGSGTPADARSSRVAADVRKSLMANRKCLDLTADGLTGVELAINTKVTTATPLDLNQAVYRGVILKVEVHFRTAKDNPYER